MSSNSSLDEYRKINSIIERDSTDATYKYALLRGTIGICEEFQHLGSHQDGRVWFPLGLMIEKWLLYYYPVIAAERFIPQKGGETADGSSHLRMAFRPLLADLAGYYRTSGGGFSQFWNDYENGRIPPQVSGTFLSLCRKLRDTITLMPMNHLGYSWARKPYSVFTYRKNESRVLMPDSIDRDFLVRSFGEYSISEELNTVFLYFGGFISGENTVLLKWATFTSEKSRGAIPVAEAMEILQEVPETERDTQEAQRFYRQLMGSGQEVECVWTGRPIRSPEVCHIDHVLPFSLWKNNELWNLMPALPEVNLKKSDMVPSDKLLDARRETIVRYWNAMSQFSPGLFEKEIRLSLVGTGFDRSSWQEQAFEALKSKCRYLIEIRGCTGWDPE
jgi:hypothetical protein